MRNVILILLGCFPMHTIGAQSPVIQDYVETYKNIAISEMARTGIPASIKLAQAILESNAGRSELATEAYNHFGIKCGNSWDGEVFYRKDDDYKDGRLVASCFRQYSDVEESFIEHSEFLRDPGKQYRYGFLFKLPITDYKSWARGLRKAGYATNPRYASLLIKVIEDYSLYVYDSNSRIERESKIEVFAAESNIPKVYQVNDVDYVIAREGETPRTISLDFGVAVERIIKYNENLFDATQLLEAGSRIFIQPKRSAYRGRKKVHYVQNGESIFAISQQYGLRLDKLVRRNKMEIGDEPAEGEKIVLRGWNLFGDRPVLREEEPSILPDAPDHQLEQDQDLLTNVGEAFPIELESSVSQQEEDSLSDSITMHKERSSDASDLPYYYTVKAGDTLYQISKKFNLTLEKLKAFNNLASHVIQPGQVLRIK